MVVKDVEREDIEFISKVSPWMGAPETLHCMPTAQFSLCTDANTPHTLNTDAALPAHHARAPACQLSAFGTFLLQALHCLPHCRPLLHTCLPPHSTLLRLYRRRCTACPSRTWTTCGPTSWAMRRWWRRWM